MALPTDAVNAGSPSRHYCLSFSAWNEEDGSVLEEVSQPVLQSRMATGLLRSSVAQSPRGNGQDRVHCYEPSAPGAMRAGRGVAVGLPSMGSPAASFRVLGLYAAPGVVRTRRPTHIRRA